MVPQDRYLYIQGQHVRYWDEGSGNKTILFVHGIACNVHYWGKTLPVLKNYYRVVAFDLL